MAKARRPSNAGRPYLGTTLTVGATAHYRCGVPTTQGDDVASPFTPRATRAILAAACADLRIESADAVLLRHGENAVYRLAHDPLVARIARHPDVPRREVEVARWLAAVALPAVRLADEVVQLRVIDRRVVTWWDLIVESPQKPTFTDLARDAALSSRPARAHGLRPAAVRPDAASPRAPGGCRRWCRGV